MLIVGQVFYGRLVRVVRVVRVVRLFVFSGLPMRVKLRRLLILRVVHLAYFAPSDPFAYDGCPP